MYTTIDYHTAGEPFRIVTSGAPQLPGSRVHERRLAAMTGPADQVRALLCNEPRGHADMYGCFLVPPDDDGAHLGALFWHKDGFSTACGHGTIALGAYAVDAGLVAAPDDGTVDVVIDVPSGRVTARVQRVAGRTASVAFRNVPAFPLARGVPVDTSRGSLRVDLSYGGASYASARATDLGLAVAAQRLPDLIALGREIRDALNAAGAANHPTRPDLSGVYGTIWYDELPDTPAGPHQRNCTVFADGEVDRSPCGSGTSARLALLHAEGRLAPGVVLRHDSIVGTTFLGQVVEVVEVDSRTAVVTEVRGNAYRTGEHTFRLDPADPLGAGFQLR
ncbi:MAG TPA: proline racemase family protein [Micromonosporaceae bacterium]